MSICVCHPSTVDDGSSMTESQIRSIGAKYSRAVTNEPCDERLTKLAILMSVIANDSKFGGREVEPALP